LALTNGLPVGRWPPFIVSASEPRWAMRRSSSTRTSGLEIVAPTLAQMVTYAQTPSFSPDASTSPSPTAIGSIAAC